MASAGDGFLMGDWAELPCDLLTLIVKQIDLYEDFVGFGGVCRSWRSIAVKENFNNSPQIPWIMLREREEKGGGGEEKNLSGFVSLTKGGMVHRVDLPEARTWKSFFSSMGWLITTNAADDMELRHPLTRVCIPLPHPRTFKYYPFYSYNTWLNRAVLSASPSVTEDYVLMVIFGGFYIGFWKPGNNIWTVIETWQASYWIDDVVYYKDQFYVCNSNGHLLLCNTNSCTSRIVGQIHDGIAATTSVCLVECGGELLLLSHSRRNVHYLDGYIEYDVWFKVFKFDSTNFNKLHRVDDFGGRSIFVGDGAAACAVMACAAGTESNCIYYADGFLNQYVILYVRKEYYVTGLYNWGAQIKRPTECMASHCPIWVSPSF